MMKKCSFQRGMTLVEVLVALTLVAITLAASTRAVAVLQQNEVHLQQRVLVELAARNLTRELMLGAQHVMAPDTLQACDPVDGTNGLLCRWTDNASEDQLHPQTRVEVWSSDGQRVLALRQFDMPPRE